MAIKLVTKLARQRARLPNRRRTLHAAAEQLPAVIGRVRIPPGPGKRQRCSGLDGGAAPGPTESPAQSSWCGHAGAGFVGTAFVRWPTLLPLRT